jgi:hypothetical protein
VRPSLLLMGCAAIAASVLAGCSDSRITSAGNGIAAPAPSADRSERQPAKAAIGEGLASVALDDHDLSGIRGGLSISSGLILNFAFQEATFVNHNLAQSIVVPTITVSPDSGTAAAAGVALPGGLSGFSPSSVAAIGNAAAQLPVNSPALAVQSILNSGMTSIVSSVNGGGVTNLISNTANNQLVQQVITANIGITGLSQTIQQSVASTVLSRVQAATSQFR